MLAALDGLDGRSLGTTSARTAWSVSSALALNLTSSTTRTSVTMSQVVKQIISVRSGNRLNSLIFMASRHVRWNTVLLSRVREISAVPLAGLCVIHCSELGVAADVNKEPSFISVLPGTLLDSSIPQASEDRHFRKFEIFLPMLWTQ